MHYLLQSNIDLRTAYEPFSIPKELVFQFYESFPIFSRLVRRPLMVNFQPFPNVLVPQHWYRIKVLRGKDREASMSYHAQYESMKQCYESLGIKSKKKTHANRGSGVTEETQLRRLGGWNADALSTSYLTNLPMEVLRAHVGFNPKSGMYVYTKVHKNV